LADVRINRITELTSGAQLTRTNSTNVAKTPAYAISRGVAQTDAIEIIFHFTEYHSTTGGIYKGKSKS
jgi:hypothetical protein